MGIASAMLFAYLTSCICNKEEPVGILSAVLHFFFFKFIYLFIYGCVGSSFLCEGFL